MKKKTAKSKKKQSLRNLFHTPTRIVITSIIVTLLLVLGAWYVLSYQKSLPDVLTELRTDIPKQVQGVTSQTGSKQTFGRIHAGLPLKVEGNSVHDFSVMPYNDNDIVYDVSDSSDYGETRLRTKTAIHDILTNNKFILLPATRQQVHNLNFSMTTDYVDTYARDDSSCQVIDLYITCYTPKLISELAARDRPFAEAIQIGGESINNLPSPKQTITIGQMSIKRTEADSTRLHVSKTPGYSVAEGYIGDGTGGGYTELYLFYKKDGGKWTYVTKAYDEWGFRCKDIKADPDAAKAFAGQLCD